MSQNLAPLPLPQGVTSRNIDLTSVTTCGLNIHVLEAGNPSDPLILLCHGYPELAFTWRKMMLPLAQAGYHVAAADSRGYGRTTGWDTSSHAHTNLSQFTVPQLVLDNIALVRALGHEAVDCIVGHDFGAQATSGCAISRPDIFKRAVFISHVPGGAPALPPLAGGPKEQPGMPRDPDIHTSLARLDPPRKHYQWDNSTAQGAHSWDHPPQGLKSMLRGYVHLKSHLWKQNYVDIGRLTGWTAEQLARMPHYYIMPLYASMPQVVTDSMRGEDASATASFMPDADLDVYVAEFARTGFQGALNWYRSTTDPLNNAAMAMLAGRRFAQPVVYLGGAADWGNFQRPGALEGFESGATAERYYGTHILEGAGHWPQTEIPELLTARILQFVREAEV